SVVYAGSPFDGSTPIRAVDAIGGWSQLKIQVTPKIELNGIVAEDNTFAGEVRGFATDDNNFGPILGRNRGALGNVVFRPRSDLVFSAELRRLRSFPVYSSSTLTTQVNLSIGILFLSPCGNQSVGAPFLASFARGGDFCCWQRHSRSQPPPSNRPSRHM